MEKNAIQVMSLGESRAMIQELTRRNELQRILLRGICRPRSMQGLSFLDLKTWRIFKVTFVKMHRLAVDLDNIYSSAMGPVLQTGSFLVQMFVQLFSRVTSTFLRSCTSSAPILSFGLPFRCLRDALEEW